MIAGNFGVESFGEFCEFVFDEDLLSLLKELKSSSMELTMMETYEKEIDSFFIEASARFFNKVASICGFYLSMLRRRHIPCIGAHPE